MAETKRDIKYLNRDFSDIRSKLIEFSQTYFPNTYNDFSPTSPGMMFMEQAAYVGDVMSFYLDNQLQENFITLARQTNNLYELAYMFGYKPKVTTAAQTEITLYQQVPTDGNNNPDLNYTLNVGENTVLSSPTNQAVNFIIQDKCDFSFSSSLDPTEITIHETLGADPAYFLLKKTRKAISANLNTETFSFGSPQQFSTVNITGDNIIKILDITDSDGNIWNEVDYLGQEMVFDNIKNTSTNDPNNVADVGEVPYLLQLKKVQRRFTTRFTAENNLQIQFGAGNPADTDELITPNPNNVGIGLPFEQDKTTTAYSPTNFLFTKTYGIAPSNTTLTVRYLTGGGVEANAPAGTLTNITRDNIKFNNVGLDNNLADYVFGTIASNNIEAATGGQSGDTDEQIRQNTLMQIAAQQRTVTLNDYKIRAMSMPSDYGTLSKVYIKKPSLNNQSTTTETLCMYVLSQNSLGQLSQPSTTLKNNLRTYLSQFKMIGDSIEIKDAYVVNISFDFEIIVLPNFINSQVILSCINMLKDYFDKDKWQINQPILINDLYVKLDRVEGVQTVKNIKISNKRGISRGYSQYAYDIEGATQNQVIYPSLDPSIFEIKYPNTDIKGRVVPL
tara:strand:+ start:2225 stop:4072 length:1848 start_codon:yes stop_codon:yes gene_type:complete